MAFKIHPYALFFPEMSAEEYSALKADILQHGQQIPIVFKNGTILDGRHRYRACQELDIEPRMMECDGRGGSELTFIASMNLHRRHLEPGQRGLIAAEIRKAKENIFPSEAIDRSGQKSGMTFAEAAAVMQVSEPGMTRPHSTTEICSTAL